MDNFQRWQCAFIFSSIFSLFCWQLPPFSIILPLLCLCVWLIFRQQVIYSAIIFAFCWFSLQAHWQLSWSLPQALIKQPVELIGVIDDIPSQHHKNLRFNLKLRTLNGKKLEFWQSASVRLSWIEAKHTLATGDLIKVKAKLKPPYGYSNDGGFSYQKWLLLKGIRATGYVLSSQSIEVLQAGNDHREQIYQHIKNASAGLNYQGILLALTVGDKQSITKSQWQLIQGAGINHLLAISGLHIGIVFLLAVVIAQWLIKTSAFVFNKHINAHKYAIVPGLIGALCYAYLAGFSVPTIRALLMLVLFSITLLCRATTDRKSIVLNALFLILLVNPLAILESGLWLSFGAVTLILLVTWWFPTVTHNPTRRYLEGMIKIQLALFFFMIPLTMILFNGFSVSGAVVNLVAVPWVSVITVPLALFGVCCELLLGSGQWLFMLADSSINILFEFIIWLQGQQGWLSVKTIPWHFWLLTVIFCITWLFPLNRLQRGYSLLFISPMLLFALETNQNFRVSVLDVGQGLSVVVEKNNKTLLYDLGPLYKTGFNTAEQVVLPYLTHQGYDQVDRLIISHSDSDHAGNWRYLIEHVTVNHIMAPQKLIADAHTCTASKYRWQGLSIEILWPIADVAHGANNNDGSCVVRIASKNHSVLLTGDISNRVERHLVTRYGKNLQSDILVAPHHGSNSSSSTGFIAAVKPKYVVYATGYLNHYRFPRAKVVERYNALAVNQLNTATLGQLSFDLSGVEITVESARTGRYKHWYYNR